MRENCSHGRLAMTLCDHGTLCFVWNALCSFAFVTLQMLHQNKRSCNVLTDSSMYIHCHGVMKQQPSYQLALFIRKQQMGQ